MVAATRRAVKLGFSRLGRMELYDQMLHSSMRRPMVAAGFAPAAEKVLRSKLSSGRVAAITAELLVAHSLHRQP